MVQMRTLSLAAVREGEEVRLLSEGTDRLFIMEPLWSGIWAPGCSPQNLILKHNRRTAGLGTELTRVQEPGADFSLPTLQREI